MKYRTVSKLCIAFVALVLPVLLSAASIVRNHGMLTYSFVQPRDYYSGMLRMRAEGANDLFYTEYGEYLTFITSYIGDRRVRLSSEIEASPPISGIRDYACPPNRLDESSIVISTLGFDDIQDCYPSYNYENCVFVVDDYWKESKEIVAFKTDKQTIFCSDKEYSDLLNGKERFVYISSSVDVFRYMNEIIPSEYRMFPQILIILAIQTFGAIIVLSALKGRYIIFSLAIAFPVGSAIISAIMICLDFIGIPFCMTSLLIICFPLLCVSLFRFEYLKTNIKSFLAFSLLTFVFLIAVSCLKMSCGGPDSLAKILLGRRLYTYGRITDFLSVAIQFGLYEIVMHGISNLFGVEVFILLYPYMSFICVITMLASTYYFADKSERLLAILSSVIGVSVLLTNSDFFLLSFWVLSNGIISTFAFIVIVCTLLSWKDHNDFSFVVAVCAFVIISTRLEGALFVSMVMFLAMLLSVDITDLKKTVIESEGLIIAWNVCLMVRLGFVKENTFWSTYKGIILIVVSLGLLCMTHLVKKLFLNELIWIHRFALTVMLSVVITVALSTYKYVAFIENRNNYLNHFIGKSDLSNSNILWLMVLLGFAGFVFQLDEFKKFSISIVIIYILVVFDLMLFRTGYPIHNGINDSSRRMLVLIMPFAVWSCTLEIGKLISTVIKE